MAVGAPQVVGVDEAVAAEAAVDQALGRDLARSEIGDRGRLLRLERAVQLGQEAHGQRMAGFDGDDVLQAAALLVPISGQRGQVQPCVGVLVADLDDSLQLAADLIPVATGQRPHGILQPPAQPHAGEVVQRSRQIVHIQAGGRRESDRRPGRRRLRTAGVARSVEAEAAGRAAHRPDGPVKGEIGCMTTGALHKATPFQKQAHRWLADFR